MSTKKSSNSLNVSEDNTKNHNNRESFITNETSEPSLDIPRKGTVNGGSRLKKGVIFTDSNMVPSRNFADFQDDNGDDQTLNIPSGTQNGGNR